MSRYIRQVTVASVGDDGQSRIADGQVTVFGTSLDAEICALYLAGAGVGRLRLRAELAELVRNLNSEIQLESFECETEFGAELDGVHILSQKESALARGSQVARDVIAGLLRGSGS